MEFKPKNREWVKNAAIVFLAVLLVLTFFSNTIMNRSLPEVATAGVTDGSIVAKVRGTGTVKANGSHNVKTTQTREIRSVMVKVGQEVSTGDTLFVLGAGDSQELEAAKETLRDLQYAYQKSAVNMPNFNYTTEMRAVETASKALDEADKAYSDAYTTYKTMEKELSNKDTLDKLSDAEEDMKEAYNTLISVQASYDQEYQNLSAEVVAWQERVNQLICVSATPGEYELSRASQVAEQVIRPTGLLDPEIEVRKVEGQVDDLLGEIKKTAAKGERVLVTTLTKRMAEMLTEYLDGMGIRVRYMHSEIETIERMEIIRDLRLGEFDVLVGINLLREGLDLPEVGLVAILDADKEGFLRSATSLIQTIGRAARNADGRVIMYADTITPSMKEAIDETARRRQKQQAYNKEHNITPRTITKAVHDIIEISGRPKEAREDREARAEILREQMRAAAAELDFETAARLRDRLFDLTGEDKPRKIAPGMPGSTKKARGRTRK